MISHARSLAPRVVTLDISNEIRKKQENPLIGEWRMHAALLQEGIKVSPRTCGRVMAKHRSLYGLDKPKGPAKPKKEMPFKASRRHEYWSIDIRYIEHHQLPNIKGPVYVISVLENFSRMLLASAISEKQDTACAGYIVRPFSKETVFPLEFHRCDLAFPAFLPGSGSLQEGLGCPVHDGFSSCSTGAIRFVSRCALSSSAMLMVWHRGRVPCLHNAIPGVLSLQPPCRGGQQLG